MKTRKLTRRPRVLVLLAIGALAVAVVSCRVPERLAPMIASRMLAAWQSVRTNDAVIVHTPDRVGAPDKKTTVRFRVRDVQGPTYGYSTRAIAPPEAAGSASGGVWGSVWMVDGRTGSLFSIANLRAWDEDANRAILVEVLRETFREFDFTRESGTWLGRDTEVVTATPLNPDPRRWKTRTVSDKETGFGLALTVFDDAGRAVSGFEATEYAVDVPFPDAEFAPPTAGVTRAVRWTVSSADNLAAERSALAFDPLLLPGRSGVHNVQAGADGAVGLVSDYTGPTESLIVVQWPESAARVSLPYARKIPLRGHAAEFSLQGPYAVMTWTEDGRNLTALGEITIGRMLDFLETLRTP